MSPADRSTAVRSYVLHPLWWLPAAAAVGLLAYVASEAAVREQTRSFDKGYDLQATVDEDYGGGAEVPLTYDNPLTGETHAMADRWGDDPAPAPGERVAIEVDRKDPRDVVLAGERYPGDPLWFVSIPAAVVLAVFGARLFGVWRTSRLIAGRGPAFAMLGTIGGAGAVSHRPRLHLYPVDAKPGADPVCTVGLHASAGIPIGGPAFVAEVKGRPRPFGRVVARVGDTVLWPRGRSLSAASSAPLPEETADPPRLEPLALGPAAVDATALRRSLVPIAVLSGAVVVGLVTTVVTQVRWRDGARLERDGVEVVATVTETHRGDFSVDATFRLPGSEEILEARIPVEVPRDVDVDDRLPAVVDPSDPQRIRLLDEPYDPLAPTVWGWIPTALALVWAGWSLHWRRRERRIANPDGPWYAVDTRQTTRHFSPLVGAEVLDVAVSHPGEAAASCIVRIPVDREGWWPLRRFRPTVQRMAISGTPSPGEPIALRHDDVVVPAIGPARPPAEAGGLGQAAWTWVVTRYGCL